MSSSSPISSSNAASEAKVKAESRRRRILEQSRTRIGVLSGEQPVPVEDDHPDGPTTTTATETESPNTATDESSPVIHSGESHSAATASSSSGLNRYAQIRKKRFISKKEGGVTEETEDKATAPVTDSVVVGGDDEPVESNESKKTQEPILNEKEVSLEDVVKEETVQQKESIAGDDETVGMDETVTGTLDPVKTEKKYLGVARMRRKLLAEQKAAASTETDATETPARVKSGVVETSKLSKRHWIHNMPLIVHLVTVWVLFLSGFQMGIQNHPSFQSHGTVMVHRNLHWIGNGMGIFSLFRNQSLLHKSIHKPVQMKETLFGSTTEIPELVSNVEELNVDKEFDEIHPSEVTQTKPAGVDKLSVNTKPSNIDPLFRVDLDEVTAGKTGFLFAAARVAISIHRYLLSIFWTYPYMLIHGIVTKPLAFFNPPLPMFFIYAVLIRFSTKYFLGIGPEPNLNDLWEKAYKGGDIKDTSSSGSGIILEGSDRSKSSNFVVPDILSVGKNFVFNMIQTKFPKLTIAYGIYKDARSDMFVVLCGFFLGVAFPLHFWVTSSSASTAARNDEL